MLCRITGKVCTAWSETAGCGLVRCKFVEDKGGDEGMTDRRKDCPMRHENGNCNVIGGFCTAVNDSICAGLHNAYDCGYCDGEIRAKQEHGQSARWISVKDRLPETNDHVLCCTVTKKESRNVIIGYYMDGAWRCGMNSNVTHWMPLPEPPGHRSGQDCYPNQNVEPAWKRQFMRTFLGGR